MAKIHLVKQAYEADVVALEVADREEADLLVFVQPSGARALGDALWFHAGKFQSTVALFWAKLGEPHALKVCFVKEEIQAGWTRNHPLQGRL